MALFLTSDPACGRRCAARSGEPPCAWAGYGALVAFRHFAQRAFCAARIRAIAAADILRRFLEAIETTI
jgi:hypothetical protein